MKARDTSKQIVGGTQELVARTKTNELRSTYRVYVKQWTPIFKAYDEQDVQVHFNSKYAGRVLDSDWEMRFIANDYLHVLSLRLYTTKAEWKDERLAEAHKVEILKDEPDADVEVVARNSRREHVLNSYGKLKLPETVKK